MSGFSIFPVKIVFIFIRTGREEMRNQGWSKDCAVLGGKSHLGQMISHAFIVEIRAEHDFVVVLTLRKRNSAEY